MAPGQRRLHCRLPLQEPVHGSVELVLVGPFDAQRAGRSGAAQTASGGWLGVRLQHSADDHGQGQFSLSTGSRRQELVEAELAELTQHGQNMAVGKWANCRRHALSSGAQRAVFKQLVHLRLGCDRARPDGRPVLQVPALGCSAGQKLEVVALLADAAFVSELA